jgi:xanthine/uracil permease
LTPPHVTTLFIIMILLSLAPHHWSMWGCGGALDLLGAKSIVD